MTSEPMTAQPRGHEEEDAGDLLDKRFARFGLRPLSDADVYALSMATMVMPDGNPGAEAYLTKVAGLDAFAGRLTIWGRVVALGVAGSSHKARNGLRRRTYVESYDESWGRYAVADGLTLALYGKAAMNPADRVTMLGCGRQGYERIRDFVGGALVNAIAEFRNALEWATGSRRDRVLEGRWECMTGLNWSETRSDERMGWERGNYFPMFAPGCARVEPLPDSDAQFEKPGSSTETLYRGLRPTDWWDEAFARQMRNAPVTMIYPATATDPPRF